MQSTRHGKNHHRCSKYNQHESLPKSMLNSLNSLVSRSQEQNDVTTRLRSKKLNMRCTCCLLIVTLCSAAAGCNNRMPMCIGSFSLHSKWIGLSKQDPNSSVSRRDVESDRLIGNHRTALQVGDRLILIIYGLSLYPILLYSLFLLASGTVSLL